MNQSGGLDSGFRDDEENIAYDKPLFNHNKVDIYSGIRNIQTGNDDEEVDGDLENVLRKRPRGGFRTEEDERAGTRTRPVEFERGETDNLLGMEGFLSKKKLKE